jgi:hypothetical protein
VSGRSLDPTCQLAGPVDGAFRKATFEKNLNEGMSLLMDDMKN